MFRQTLMLFYSNCFQSQFPKGKQQQRLVLVLDGHIGLLNHFVCTLSAMGDGHDDDDGHGHGGGDSVPYVVHII